MRRRNAFARQRSHSSFFAPLAALRHKKASIRQGYCAHALSSDYSRRPARSPPFVNSAPRWSASRRVASLRSRPPRFRLLCAGWRIPSFFTFLPSLWRSMPRGKAQKAKRLYSVDEEKKAFSLFAPSELLKLAAPVSCVLLFARFSLSPSVTHYIHICRA